MTTRFIHILRQSASDSQHRWLPARSWMIWGGVEALEWNDSRWRELGDGDYRLVLGDNPPISFTVMGGKAYLDNGEPLRLASG